MKKVVIGFTAALMALLVTTGVAAASGLTYIGETTGCTCRDRRSNGSGNRIHLLVSFRVSFSCNMMAKHHIASTILEKSIPTQEPERQVTRTRSSA